MKLSIIKRFRFFSQSNFFYPHTKRHAEQVAADRHLPINHLHNYILRASANLICKITAFRSKEAPACRKTDIMSSPVAVRGLYFYQASHQNHHKRAEIVHDQKSTARKYARKSTCTASAKTPVKKHFKTAKKVLQKLFVGAIIL